MYHVMHTDHVMHIPHGLEGAGQSILRAVIVIHIHHVTSCDLSHHSSQYQLHTALYIPNKVTTHY